MIGLKVSGLKYRLFSMKTICCYFLAIALSFSLIGCGKFNATTKDSYSSSLADRSSQLSEVTPPKLIRDLAQSLKSYNPQVKIITPKLGKTLETTSTNIELSVTDLPLFKDQKLGLGFNLHLILDNEPYIPIYNVEEPIKLEDLTPGTHTVRVIACLPWHESFKNKGAYAETTFNVLTATEDNYPDPNTPLLTYSSPTGNYSAEPIMLDFYLKTVSQKKSQSTDIGSNSLGIKVTVNDQSFMLDRWQPVYLKGFKKGNNLVELTLLDSEGKEIKNSFNNTVRIITYKPDASDSLAKIVTNQISFEQAKAIIDPEYSNKLAKDSAPETKIDNTLSTEDSSLKAKDIKIEESNNIKVEESNEPVIEELETEAIEKAEKSVSDQESEKIKSEVEALPKLQDLDNTESKVDISGETVIEQPEIEKE